MTSEKTPGKGGRPCIDPLDKHAQRRGYYTTTASRRTIEAWCVQYTSPEDRMRTRRNMSDSEAFRQICELAAKKITRDRAREGL